ncbi:hypothetical protein E4T39_07850 [Aureobasidium subglaciale]|nr:hypothetical protein E4T39_07850 [Aureobasidium subglaciale]
MPVSYVGLTVSHIPSACSFFLSALQPLGYRYIGNQGDSIGFGTDDADFFLSPEAPGVSRSNAHVAFSATSKAAVRDFYAAALTAGGRPNGAPAFRGCDDCIFNAAVLDLDGNSIEVIYHQVDNEDAYTTISGGSRVLDWRKGIVNVLGDEDRTTFVSTRSQHETEQKPTPSIARTSSMPTVPTMTPAISSPDSGIRISSKAIIGTILGAAAGAAVAYAMVKSERDSAQQETEFAEKMARKSASSRVSSKPPSNISSGQAPQTSKAKIVLRSSTMSKNVPADRLPANMTEELRSRPRTKIHRNYSTTESVVASRVMEDFGGDDAEIPLLTHKPRSVRAVEADPEPQPMSSNSHHSPTYVSLASISRSKKKSEPVYIPASQALIQTLPRIRPVAPSVTPTERQIEYFPASAIVQRPTIVTRRAVTSPASICNTDHQIEDVSVQAYDSSSQDLVVARRDSAMSMYSTHSNMAITPTEDLPEGITPIAWICLLTEPADTLTGLASTEILRLSAVKANTGETHRSGRTDTAIHQVIIRLHPRGLLGIDLAPIEIDRLTMGLIRVLSRLAKSTHRAITPLQRYHCQRRVNFLSPQQQICLYLTLGRPQ